jgi:uncharacterized protein (TIGR02145 family)
LIDYLGGSSVAGGKMKSTGTFEDGDGLWHTPTPGNATNESGFTVLPSGFRHQNGNFVALGQNWEMWTTTEYDDNTLFYTVNWNSEGIFSATNHEKQFGKSIRCIQD